MMEQHGAMNKTQEVQTHDVDKPYSHSGSIADDHARPLAPKKPPRTTSTSKRPSVSNRKSFDCEFWFYLNQPFPR